MFPFIKNKAVEKYLAIPPVFFVCKQNNQSYMVVRSKIFILLIPEGESESIDKIYFKFFILPKISPDKK